MKIPVRLPLLALCLAAQAAAALDVAEAYGFLMKTFPKETPRNRTSFFDHLCALDFL